MFFMLVKVSIFLPKKTKCDAFSEDERGKERKNQHGMLGNLYRYGLALAKKFLAPKRFSEKFLKIFYCFSPFDVIIDSSGVAI